MTAETIRIATRESRLALWQAEHVKARLQAQHADLNVELLPMTTSGDQLLDRALTKEGGKGLFVKELEAALLERRADIAVHSMKDLPAQLPRGLEVVAVLERENPLDALVSAHASLEELPLGARVGTSSLRRQMQLRRTRFDLEVEMLRGNVETRLRKLDEGQFDAIILACAGLRRLGLAARIREELRPEQFLPAIGQGAIGIECRVADEHTRALLQPLNHYATEVCVVAERALNAGLGGSCHTPVAGYAELRGEVLYLRGRVGTPDGARLLEAEVSGQAHNAIVLGTVLAQRLRKQGADEILRELAAQ